MAFHGSHPENLLKSDEYGLSADMLPQELGGTLPHGDELAKVRTTSSLLICTCDNWTAA